MTQDLDDRDGREREVKELDSEIQTKLNNIVYAFLDLIPLDQKFLVLKHCYKCRHIQDDKFKKADLTDEASKIIGFCSYSQAVSRMVRSVLDAILTLNITEGGKIANEVIEVLDETFQKLDNLIKD